LLRRMREAIRLKSDDPDLEHREQYPAEGLQKVSGALTIVGLSPYNDNHVFDQLVANHEIASIRYYYHAEAEAATAAKRLEGKPLVFLDVRDLWNEIEAG